MGPRGRRSGQPKFVVSQSQAVDLSEQKDASIQNRVWSKNGRPLSINNHSWLLSGDKDFIPTSDGTKMIENLRMEEQ